MSYDLDTTKVLLEKGDKESKNVYYIPGFFRIKVKNFTEMNLDNLDAQMNATIIFSVYYGSLDEHIVYELMKNIILLFGRDDAIKLTDEDNLETKITRKEKEHEIQFTIRKLFHLRIESEVFWSPFEIINLILSITVQPVITKWGTVKINLLDHDENNFIKLSYTEEGTFGNYDLAEKLMRAQYTNDRVCKINDMNEEEKLKQEIVKHKSDETKKKYLEGERKESIKKKYETRMSSSSSNNKDDKKIEHFQYAHFNVPLYKFPLVALATIFLPLWLLAIINLGIFFQDNSLSDRIASIAALMIAFVALIPTIRDQIPPNPRIVFVEILVYFETLTSLFALIHSLDIRNDSNFDLVWYQDGLFLVSFIITLITIASVLVMLILHYAIWEPGYNRDLSEETDEKFQRSQWKNEYCDYYFSQINCTKKKKIIMLDDPIKN